MYKLLIYILFIICMPLQSFAQDFNYVHYDTKDGLAGSTVYDECQDKDGFMWFATENGLSRFDGTHFKNFTVKDGLPDNEVLKLFADSKGRVWIGTFNKELCYYFKGKIYDRKNDSLVNKINLKVSLSTVAENSSGTIAFSDQQSVTFVESSGLLYKMESQDIYGKQADLTIGNQKGRIWINTRPEISDMIFEYTGNGKIRLTRYKNALRFSYGSESKFVGIHWNDNEEIDKEAILPVDIISVENYNGWITFVNTNNGAYAIDTVNYRTGIYFLPGKKITRTIHDKEDNLWFSTYGDGVYRLPSTDIKTINISSKTITDNKEIFSLGTYKNALVGGLGFSKAVVVDVSNKSSVKDYSRYEIQSANQMKNNRLYTMKKLDEEVLMLGFDGFLVKLDHNKPFVNLCYPIKSIERVNAEEVLIGTSACAIKMRVKDMVVTDTIWKGRCTKVFAYNNKCYIGTLNGLFTVNPDKTHDSLGALHKVLTRRIADIKLAPDGNIWVATSDQGLVAFKDGKITAVINDTNGLSSNICKTLFLKDNFLWVGTNKGINKINLSDKEHTITRYSISEGLPSDVINALYVDDSTVWVGSPGGLSYFNEKNISLKSMCHLIMESVSVSGKILTDSSLELSYKDNNISFEYVAVSMKSGKEITYSYRLNGFNSDWRKTAETTLSYQSLPPGNYTFEIFAINKYLEKSDTIKIQFVVGSPFWKAWWFYFLIILSTIGLTIWLVNRRNLKIRSRLEERNMFQKQFAALEQQALQSQMNPHFIFNCLNSIQQYILTNDKEKANQYLTGFASLVRQTLDNSDKRTITVAQEMLYLKQYLDMERMRFGDNFTYTIHADESVEADYTEIPALLLQPYAENCLRHGIRYKEDGSGIVDISFSMKDTVLYCVIKDNGVGRERAAALKSQQHIEYQSKGMNLTKKRIDLLNKMYDNHITVDVKDLKDEAGKPCGTEVTVKIPE